MLSEATTNIAAPVSLADYTRLELVVPLLRERDTAGIISELSHILQHQGGVPDVLPFYQAALNQELLTNSALDTGLALPHARMSGVKQLQFAFGRTPDPVVWCGRSSWPVQLIFLLAVPATDVAGYLALARQPRPAGPATRTPGTAPRCGYRRSHPGGARADQAASGMTIAPEF